MVCIEAQASGKRNGLHAMVSLSTREGDICSQIFLTSVKEEGIGKRNSQKVLLGGEIVESRVVQVFVLCLWLLSLLCLLLSSSSVGDDLTSQRSCPKAVCHWWEVMCASKDPERHSGI